MSPAHALEGGQAVDALQLLRGGTAAGARGGALPAAPQCLLLGVVLPERPRGQSLLPPVHLHTPKGKTLHRTSERHS